VADSGRALVVGVTGIAGHNVARRLVESGWDVHGRSRPGAVSVPGVHPVAADVLDAAAVASAVTATRPTHVFYCTWQRQATEAENCRVNAAMLRNVLDPLVGGDVRHVVLVTGLKHYLGRQELPQAGTFGRVTGQLAR
jgi:nucleoside-diphosphate-sugar epimerase